MPIYEFRCKKCGNIFEYLCLKSSDRENATCPSCGQGKAEVLLSTFSSAGAGSAGGGASLSSSSCSSHGGFS
ncbi:MAG: zinc ribbon domain-containing protein [Deltaproteobacteria bacterium]|nr:zinc ribbon domain-containing protein [Deltaproteobacteria bacterium]